MTTAFNTEEDYTEIPGKPKPMWRRRSISGFALVSRSASGKWLWKAVPYDKETSEEVSGTAINFGTAKSQADLAIDNF